jgi:tripartite-type tricarboxylate transporter receptor subunit TctC
LRTVITRRPPQARAVCAVAALCGMGVVAAQEAAFPQRTVQIIVPYSTGTTADILARTLGPRLAERWKVNVVADNRPGATGAIGAAAVAKATPDGHTLLFVAASFAIIPAVYPALGFDPVKSFAPVTQLTTSALGLVTHPQVPAHNVRELVALAKKRPGELFYVSAGNGSAQHLVMELFKLDTGTQIVHVPYRALATAFTDLMGGHAQLTISTLQTVQGFVNGGRLRLLGVSSAQRAAAFPAVPTLKEQGLAIDVETWSGALAPAATPPGVVGRISKDMNDLLSTPEHRETLSRQGMSAAGGAPEQFDALIKSELTRWARVVKAANIRFD